MMKTEKNIPALRFPEFEGEWSRKSLGSEFEIVGGGTPDTTIKDFWNGTIKWFTPTEIKSKYIYNSIRTISDKGLKNSSAKLLPPGSILFTSRATIGDIGITLYECTTNQGFQSFLPNANNHNEFLYYLIKKNIKEFIMRASGSTFLEISKNEIQKVRFLFPRLSEQQKIASFLSSVDQRIHLLTQKKEKLEQYKKGLMQRIFSQELRFKPALSEVEGDKNGQDYPDWEEKRLGEICQIRRGASPRPISDPKWFDENSRIGWVRISDVTKSGKILLKTDQYLSYEGINQSRKVSRNNLIMSICATIGKPVYTGIDVCIHDGFVVFENLTCNKEYLYYFLNHIEGRWYRYGQPGIQLNLNTEIVFNETIDIPDWDEQHKIATFLSSIDDKINHINSQIELTRKWKQGLLQKMFV